MNMLEMIPRVRLLPDKGGKARHKLERDPFKKATRSLHVITYPYAGNGEARCNFIYVHGLRGYGEQNLEIIHQFQEYGNVFVTDFPGHGRSPGGKCRINHIRYFEEAVHRTCLKALKYDKDLPICILGFSVGALITMHYLFSRAPERILKRIAGVACAGMPIDVSKEMDPWIIRHAHALAYLLPWLPLWNLCIDKKNISLVKEERERVLRDPLVYKGPLRMWTAYSIHMMTLSVREYLHHHFSSTETSQLQEEPLAARLDWAAYSLRMIWLAVRQSFRHEASLLRVVPKKLHLPLFFLRGEGDSISAREAYEEAGIPLKDYPQLLHVVLSGENTETPRADILMFFEKSVTSWCKEKQRSEKVSAPV